MTSISPAQNSTYLKISPTDNPAERSKNESDSCLEAKVNNIKTIYLNSMTEDLAESLMTLFRV